MKTVDERATHAEILRSLQAHRRELHGHQVYLFGSRARGEASRFSDFDIGIDGPKPLDLSAFFEIEDSLDRIPTLYQFDLVDLNRAPRGSETMRGAKVVCSMRPEHVLPDFKRALDRFNEAMALEPVDDVHRAGCIQYFEFTFDLAWKSIQSVATFYGLESVRSPRVAFKTAFSQGWIEEQEPWLEMLNARNRMSTFTMPKKRLVFIQIYPLFVLHLSSYI